MQSAASRIWTRIAVSISHDDNHYTTGTSDFNNIVVLIDTTRLLIFKYSSNFNNPSVTVPKTPYTIGINVTFMFHSFFSSLEKLSFFIVLSILFCGQPEQQSPQLCKFCFLLIIIRSRLLTFLCQNLIGVCVSHSPGQMLGCAYTFFFVW